MDGFGDITKCRHFEELPETAKKYVRFIEKEVGCKISYISVGPGRDEYIKVD
jgi:adenylosuccinate synthase